MAFTPEVDDADEEGPPPDANDASIPDFFGERWGVKWVPLGAGDEFAAEPCQVGDDEVLWYVAGQDEVDALEKKGAVSSSETRGGMVRTPFELRPLSVIFNAFNDPDVALESGLLVGVHVCMNIDLDQDGIREQFPQVGDEIIDRIFDSFEDNRGHLAQEQIDFTIDDTVYQVPQELVDLHVVEPGWEKKKNQPVWNRNGAFDVEESVAYQIWRDFNVNDGSPMVDDVFTPLQDVGIERTGTPTATGGGGDDEDEEVEAGELETEDIPDDVLESTTEDAAAAAREEAEDDGDAESVPVEVSIGEKGDTKTLVVEAAGDVEVSPEATSRVLTSVRAAVDVDGFDVGETVAEAGYEPGADAVTNLQFTIGEQGETESETDDDEPDMTPDRAAELFTTESRSAFMSECASAEPEPQIPLGDCSKLAAEIFADGGDEDDEEDEPEPEPEPETEPEVTRRTTEVTRDEPRRERERERVADETLEAAISGTVEFDPDDIQGLVEESVDAAVERALLEGAASVGGGSADPPDGGGGPTPAEPEGDLPDEPDFSTDWEMGQNIALVQPGCLACQSFKEDPEVQEAIDEGTLELVGPDHPDWNDILAQVGDVRTPSVFMWDDDLGEFV